MSDPEDRITKVLAITILVANLISILALVGIIAGTLWFLVERGVL